MYYVLLEKQPGQAWTIQFSDEDLETVQDERDSYEEANETAARYRIISVRNDSQAAIQAKLDKINATEKRINETCEAIQVHQFNIDGFFKGI